MRPGTSVCSAGRPIHTTVDGESRRIIEGAGDGVFSPPEDADAFVAVLSALAWIVESRGDA
jgi:hypothetical protein